VTPLTAGFGVRWSRDGRWLAYVDGGRLKVIRPDGTDERELVPETSFQTGLDWSPGSEWLVAKEDSGERRIVLVRVDGGEVVPLPLTDPYRQPSWRP
jgi:hypothetical protein